MKIMGGPNLRLLYVLNIPNVLNLLNVLTMRLPNPTILGLVYFFSWRGLAGVERVRMRSFCFLQESAESHHERASSELSGLERH